MDTPPAIQTNGLTKRYGDFTALDSLSLSIERGEIFGFLGPNGAGKSTTIRILLDLIRPTAGRARILGFDCQQDSREVRGRIGYLPGELRLYENLRGRETVELVAGMRPGSNHREETYGIAERLGLDLDRHAGTYSKGNRQKLGLLLALMGQPEVLLLDEPTSGLDPIVQHEVWAILREEAARGTTVFFSSHVMSEVDEICERIAILRDGALATVAPISEIKGRSARRLEVGFRDRAPEAGAFNLAGVRELRRGDRRLEFEVSEEVGPLLRALAEFDVIDLRTTQPTLEDLLLTYYEDARA